MNVYCRNGSKGVVKSDIKLVVEVEVDKFSCITFTIPHVNKLRVSLVLYLPNNVTL